MSAANATEKSAEAIAAKDLANATNAKAQWERAQTLLDEQVTAQQDYDTAKANYDASQAQVTADQAQIDAAKQNIHSAQASVQVAESQLATAQAQERQTQAALQQAQINLDHTRIMAPVDGTVVARRMDIGQTVAATLNPPTIFEIAQDLTKMQVDTNVDESDVGNVAKGQKATFIVDSYPGTTFPGCSRRHSQGPHHHAERGDLRRGDHGGQRRPEIVSRHDGQRHDSGGKTRRHVEGSNAVLRFRPSAAVLKKTGLPPAQADKQQLYVLTGGKQLAAVPVKFGISDGKYTAVRSNELQSGAQAVVRATLSGTGSGASTTTSAPTAPRM